MSEEKKQGPAAAIQPKVEPKHPSETSPKEVRLWVNEIGKWECEYIERDRAKHPMSIRDYTGFARVMLVAWRLFAQRRKLESIRKAE